MSEEARKTAEAVLAAPDNLIYVDPAGLIQLADLKALARAYLDMVDSKFGGWVGPFYRPTSPPAPVPLNESTSSHSSDLKESK